MIFTTPTVRDDVVIAVCLVHVGNHRAACALADADADANASRNRRIAGAAAEIV